MTKKIFSLLVGGLVLLSVTLFAGAAGGDASDPLASLSYLTGVFTKTVDAQIDEKLDASDAALLESAQGGSLSSCAATWTETRMKEGDVLSGSTGTNVLVLAGRVQVAFSFGAVIDVTTGTAVPSGTVLTADHRYMVAEDTAALFTVTLPW